MTEHAQNTGLHLLRGRLLAQNAVWNLAGTVTPLAVAIVTVPLLVHTLGTASFGLLTLAWTVIGYASLLDLGLGRALTQLVAKKLGTGEAQEIPSLVWTSLVLMLLLGILGTVIMLAVSPWLVHRVFKIPAALQPESLRAFYILGLSIPVVVVSAGLRGLLEAYQRFDLASALRIPIGVLTFAGPLLVLPFSKTLGAVVGVLVVGRTIGCVANFLLCLRVVPALRQGLAWHSSSVRPLLRFGSWLTVGNVVGPLMLYMDRFVIGALVSATAVAYYATPYEVATKLFAISGAVTGVMFPAFSLSAVTDRARSSILYRRAMNYMLVMLLPITIVLMVGTKVGLSLWLGANFAANSYRVAQLLLVGTFSLGMATLPFVYIQGLGRPDIPPKLNLVEIPVYAVGLYWLIHRYGVTGAAFAWMLRALVDSVLLFYFAYRLQRSLYPEISQVPMGHVVPTEP